MCVLKYSYLLVGVLVLVGGGYSAEDSSDSVRSIINVDSPLPVGANLDELLSENPEYEPFMYRHTIMSMVDEERKFNYDPNHEYGPHNWHKHHPKCGGDQQSPINIRSNQCERHTFSSPFTYHKSDKIPKKVNIENDGYTVTYTFEFNGTRPHLTGGPLKSSYVFESIHMHWGKRGAGSEHAIDGQRTDLEIHMLHRNVKYATVQEATEHSDGITVIGVMASVSRTMERLHMFKNIADVRYPMSRVELSGRPMGYILRNLIGFMPEEEMLAYRGSLTTPDCSEATLWLVPRRIRKISYEDMEEIRKVMANKNQPMGPNNRPLQSSNKRPCIMFKMKKQY